jgi:protein-tyrosine phosphatase
MKKILFVCTGNICRSPTAEAIARHKIKELNLEQNFYFDSAATHGHHHGEKPDYRSVEVGEIRGISFKNILSRKVSDQDFINFDHILCMTDQHLADLKKTSDQKFHHKIDLLLRFVDLKNPFNNQVIDPYYSSQSSFEMVFDLIENAVDLLIEKCLKTL